MIDRLKAVRALLRLLVAYVFGKRTERGTRSQQERSRAKQAGRVTQNT
jgi:hypothetical protein